GIEHFGSTAVPGLPAKPIVDILVGACEGSGPDAAINGLARLGYEYLGEDGRRPGRYFWRKRGADAFNVSVVEYRGLLWQTNIE
ncbi:GrpB family protein, partial [Bacillus sp. SIMBA_069]